MRQKSRRTILRRIFKPSWLYLVSRQLKPLSRNYGSDRGEPIDRYYIEKFLSENANLIKGNCLEIESNAYCLSFGKNCKCDVLDINKSNPKATITADLRSMPEIKNETYDCIILTQVLQFVDDYESAIRECQRVLKSGGVLLATLPFVSRTDVRAGISGDFWRFTRASTQYVFGKYFPQPEVKSWGNILSGLGFWVGMAQEELLKKELDHNDPDFPVLISVKAIK